MLGGLSGELLKLATGYELPSGADVLGNLGMDRDSLLTKGLGFGADLLTDPLTWGGGVALSALGKAGKVASAGRQASLIGRLENMASSGLKNQAATQAAQLETAAAARAGMPLAERLAKIPVQSKLIREPGLAQPLSPPSAFADHPTLLKYGAKNGVIPPFEPSVSPSFNPGPMSFDPTYPTRNPLLERLMEMVWKPNRPGSRATIDY